MKIPILYEDESVVVINKPAGLVVHSDGRTKEYTVATWMFEQYPDSYEVGEPLIIPITNNKQPITISRPGIVHRLDKETSGVLLLAKNQDTYLYVK